jgi:hypothetical protein
VHAGFIHRGDLDRVAEDANVFGRNAGEVLGYRTLPMSVKV